MRLKLTENKIKMRINAGVKQSITIASNTLLDIHDKGIATFHFRGQIDGERKRHKIGTYGNNGAHFMTLDDAIKKVTDMKRLISEGVNPLWVHYGGTIMTVDDLFQSFFEASSCSYKTEKRMYELHIKPRIGSTKVGILTTKHLQRTLKEIVEQDQLSIAQRTLYLFRSVFSDAFENSIINKNVARTLDLKKHAGGGSKGHGVALAEMHLKSFLSVAQQYPLIFPEPTMIALALLLIFGFRKMELLSAQWSDLDWEQKELHIWADRSKNNLAIAVPIPDSVIPLFKQLEVLADGSNYLFPSRRRGSTPHIHDSTINSALNNLFGKNTRNKAYQENILGELGIPYFNAHDLRRTFRSLLPKYNVDEAVGEACLNHKPRGIIAVYNKYKYLDQRRIAHDKMAKVILPMAGFEYRNEKIFNTVRTNKAFSPSPTVTWGSMNFNNTALGG